MFAHLDIFKRSELIISAATLGFSTIMNKLVSSANKRMLDPVSVTMSLKNIKY